MLMQAKFVENPVKTNTQNLLFLQRKIFQNLRKKARSRADFFGHIEGGAFAICMGEYTANYNTGGKETRFQICLPYQVLLKSNPAKLGTRFVVHSAEILFNENPLYHRKRRYHIPQSIADMDFCWLTPDNDFIF